MGEQLRLQQGLTISHHQLAPFTLVFQGKVLVRNLGSPAPGAHNLRKCVRGPVKQQERWTQLARARLHQAALVHQPFADLLGLSPMWRCQPGAQPVEDDSVRATTPACRITAATRHRPHSSTHTY